MKKPAPDEAEEAQRLLNAYNGLYRKDFYFDDERYKNYLAGKQSGVHFNSASMAAPFPAVRKKSEKILKKETFLSHGEKEAILNEARIKAAALVGLPENLKTGVAFGRNTTEAASFVYWLAGLGIGDRVVLTNAENVSLKRMFEVHLDHGNPRREDGWSTWATHYSERGPRYKDFIPNTTGVETSVIEVLSASDDGIESQLHEQINANTRAFVFSHVLRNSGRELPVRVICDMARRIKAQKNSSEPDLFILVDGAQALGNVPQVNFEELGCDAYVATPHKTMRSEVLGILYFNPRNPTIQQRLGKMNELYYRDQQVILEGMFEESFGVRPNVNDSLSYADVVGFSAAVDELKESGLQSNDFTAIATIRQELKTYCEQRLRELSSMLGIEIIIPQVSNNTSFILPVQIPEKNGRMIAEKLAERGIFLSYIEGNADKPFSRILRISFQVGNTKNEVDEFIRSLEDILSTF